MDLFCYYTNRNQCVYVDNINKTKVDPINTLYLLNEHNLSGMPKYLLYLHLVNLNDPYNILPKYLLYLYLYKINIDIRLSSYLVYLKSIWGFGQNSNYYGLCPLLYIWIVKNGTDYNFKVINNIYVKILKRYKWPTKLRKDSTPPRRVRSRERRNSSRRGRYHRDSPIVAGKLSNHRRPREAPHSPPLAVQVKPQNKCTIS